MSSAAFRSRTMYVTPNHERLLRALAASQGLESADEALEMFLQGTLTTIPLLEQIGDLIQRNRSAERKQIQEMVERSAAPAV